ncbi:MAG TPA: exopolyphosphatase [Gammaproteobacteria bacterium]|nr:exopolyphosphatase [Gammaproteobacteria bacterium]
MNYTDNKSILAAVDLGSNSFHMIIARQRDGHFHVIDKLREMVQLRAGLNHHQKLSAKSQQRALDCLARFKQRLQDLPVENVRVVATNTLRVAKNSATFLKKAEQALGHPIEIITGEEEARLIYLGVAYDLSFDNQRRLVMDIGGGSTECIIGEGEQEIQRQSIEMGCVSFSHRFFALGEITKGSMKQAILAAEREFYAIQKNYRDLGWHVAVGASGTIRCVAECIQYIKLGSGGKITEASLDKLIEWLVITSEVESVPIPGLSAERKAVLPGGVAILKAAFRRLHIDTIIVSDGALREGLLCDLNGRIHLEDERDKTVKGMIKRYDVDEQQIEHIQLVVTHFIQQAKKLWQLSQTEEQQLLWAAQLHEIGLSLSHEQSHKHGHYLFANSYLPGFSRDEQQIIALLILGQRKRIPVKRIERLPNKHRLSIMRMLMLLRLAVLFVRGRAMPETGWENVTVIQDQIRFGVSTEWLANNPLTYSDLLHEQMYASDSDISLLIQPLEAINEYGQ